MEDDQVEEQNYRLGDYQRSMIKRTERLKFKRYCFGVYGCMGQDKIIQIWGCD